MPRYLSRPYEVNAVKWTGGHDQEHHEEWLDEAMRLGVVEMTAPGTPEVCLVVKNTLGVFQINRGDYVVLSPTGQVIGMSPMAFESGFTPIPEE